MLPMKMVFEKVKERLFSSSKKYYCEKLQTLSQLAFFWTFCHPFNLSGCQAFLLQQPCLIVTVFYFASLLSFPFCL